MHSDNPYAAPVTLGPAVEVTKADELRIASQGKRFLNLILDSVVTQIVSGMAGLVIGIIYGMSRAAQGMPITPEDETMHSPSLAAKASPLVGTIRCRVQGSSTHASQLAPRAACQ